MVPQKADQGAVILKDFDSAMRALDEQERILCGGMAVIRVALAQTESLPRIAWPVAVLLRMRGRRMLRKGERLLLKNRQTRDRMLDNEVTLREAMVRRNVWGRNR